MLYDQYGNPVRQSNPFIPILLVLVIAVGAYFLVKDKVVDQNPVVNGSAYPTQSSVYSGTPQPAQSLPATPDVFGLTAQAFFQQNPDGTSGGGAAGGSPEHSGGPGSIGVEGNHTRP